MVLEEKFVSGLDIPALQAVGWEGITFLQILFAEYSVFFLGAPGTLVVTALDYKTEDRGFDSRWCDWSFSISIIIHYGPQPLTESE